jgi:hypothetical protein
MKKDTQVEEMVSAWTNLQRQFWDNCLQTNSKSKKTQLESACKRPLELTRDMLSESVKTQAMLTRDALRLTDSSLLDSGMLDQYFDTVQRMIDSSIDSQEEMLESWFNCAKEIEQQLPEKSMSQWSSLLFQIPTKDGKRAANNMMESWQDATEKTLEVQKEFVSKATDEASKAAHKKGSSTKTSGSASKSVSHGGQTAKA